MQKTSYLKVIIINFKLVRRAWIAFVVLFTASTSFCYSQTTISENHISSVKKIDTVYNIPKKLSLSVTPLSVGNLLARENLFFGTHFSINWLLKRNLIISLKVDAVQKFELFGYNEYMLAWGSLCTYNIKMKHGYIEVGSGLSFVAGQADTDIKTLGWIQATYHIKKIRTIGLDFKLARIYIHRAKNAGIAFSFYGNINNHTSFLNFGIGFKAPYFLNHKKQKP